MGYTDRREVKQFQYTAWPDHGVPEHPAPFLQFLRRIVAMNTPDAGPVITHCRYFCYFDFIIWDSKKLYKNRNDVLTLITIHSLIVVLGLVERARLLLSTQCWKE